MKSEQIRQPKMPMNHTDNPAIELLAVILASDSAPGRARNVLRPILGQPLFVRTVERVRRAAHVGRLLVVTTIDPQDAAITTTFASPLIVIFAGSRTQASTPAKCAITF